MSTYFSKVSHFDANDILNLGMDGLFTVWQKSRTEKKVFRLKLEGNSYEFFSIKNDYRLNGDFLCHFSFDGVAYFLEIELKENKFNIKNLKSFYKAERRGCFRLYLGKNESAVLSFEISSTPIESDKNVISLKSKESETGLFVDFLKLLDNETQSDEVVFSIRDISLTGVSFLVSSVEKSFVKLGKDILNLKLNLFDLSIIIPRCKIMRIEGNNPYIVGMQFFDLSESSRAKLNFQINKILLEMEDQFEKKLS
jgi:hypothetical protein